jgi:hypothetical protein
MAFLEDDVAKFVASLSKKEAYAKYVETRIADTLDDVDCSLSTMRWNGELIGQLESALGEGKVKNALSKIAKALGKTKSYCSGAPYSYAGA